MVSVHKSALASEFLRVGVQLTPSSPPSLSLPSRPLPFSPPFHLFYPFSTPLSSLPVRSNPARGLGECCELPSGVSGRAPAEIEFRVF